MSVCQLCNFFERKWPSKVTILRSQFVTSRWGGRRYLPYAFTEQGVAIRSSALRSKRAIQVNIAIMRALVRIKQVLATHKELAKKLKKLEGEVGKHNKLIIEIFDTIKQLTQPPTSLAKPKPIYRGRERLLWPTASQ